MKKNKCKKWIHGRPAFFWREMEEEWTEGGVHSGRGRDWKSRKEGDCSKNAKNVVKGNLKRQNKKGGGRSPVCASSCSTPFPTYKQWVLIICTASYQHCDIHLWILALFSIFPSKRLGAKLVDFMSMFCSLARAVSAQVCPDELLLTLYSSVKLPHVQLPLFSHQLLHMLPVFTIRKYFFHKKERNGLVTNKAAKQKSYQFSWLMWFLCKDFIVKTVYQETEIIF